jgi:hypothetical protein
MKKAGIRGEESLVTDDQAAKGSEPREGTLDDPAVTIAAQLAPILVGRVGVIGQGWNDRLNAPTGESSTERVRVIRSVRDQAIGTLPGSPRRVGTRDGDRGERAFEERDLVRRRRVQVCSQRSTCAIDHHHPLRALAPLGFPNRGPPFFAGAKLPSAKHSSQRSLSASCSSARSARHSASNVPSASQSRSRRQHVVGLPYRRGNSLHGAPVHRIHKIPSKHRR